MIQQDWLKGWVNGMAPQPAAGRSHVNEAYSLDMASRLDRACAWVCFVGFNVTMVVLLCVQASYQTADEIVS